MERKSLRRLSLVRIFLVVGSLSLACMAAIRFFTSSASASNPPDLSITATPSSGLSNAFYLGQTFTLMLTGAPINATFTICAVYPSGIHNCTPNWGMTDASGSWTQSGTWIASTTPTGDWEEGLWFPAQNLYSNGINFTMASSGPGTAPGSTPPSGGTPPVTPPATPPATPPITTQPVTPGQPPFSISAINSQLLSPFAADTKELQNVVDQLKNLGGGSGGGTPPESTFSVTPPTASLFPATILVTASSLNVRSAPNTSAPLAGSGTLAAGDEFVATNEVTGESVDGNDLWWVSSLGNYVWSGGTELAPTDSGLKSRSTNPNAPVIASVQGYNPITNAYETNANIVATGDTYLILYGAFAGSGDTVSLNGTALPASDLTYDSATQINVDIGSSYAGMPFTVSVTDADGTSALIGVNGASVTTVTPPETTAPTLPAPVTKTVTSVGASYSVTYSYLQDGEVRATFTYKGNQYVEQNYSAFQGASGLAMVEPDGSFGRAYTGEADLTLLDLANQVSGNSPANKVIFPGYTFMTALYWTIDTSPYYADVPVGAFDMTKSAASNVPALNFYYLTTDASGNLIGATPLVFPSGTLQTWDGSTTKGTEIVIAPPSSGPTAPTMSHSAVQNATLQAVGFQAAIAIAKNAGYVVEVNGDTAIVRDPQTNAVVAAISQSNN